MLSSDRSSAVGAPAPPETLSVVIPAYKAAGVIAHALESIAVQTIPPVEVIVVDDASSDETEAVVEARRETLSRRGIALTYIGLMANGGPSGARNAGMRSAKGSHVAFLDADDVWHPSKLEIVKRHLEGTTAGMIFHAYTERTEFADPGQYEHRNVAVPPWRFLIRNPAQTSCVVVRRAPEIRFDPSMRYCEDHDLWLRIAETAGARMLIGPPLTRLGRPQLAAGGLSGNRPAMRRGEMTVFRHFCARRRWTRGLLLPLLFAYSAAKHGRQALRRHLRRI